MVLVITLHLSRLFSFYASGSSLLLLYDHTCRMFSRFVYALTPFPGKILVVAYGLFLAVRNNSLADLVTSD